MFFIEYLLGLHEFIVELGQRKFRREHGMLDVEKSIIAALKFARFRKPRFRARVRSVDADVDNFRYFQAPLPNDLEALMVLRVPPAASTA